MGKKKTLKKANVKKANVKKSKRQKVKKTTKTKIKATAKSSSKAAVKKRVRRAGASGKLTAKQAAYATARADGLPAVKAVAAAGYDCRNRRSASALGGKIENKLRDQGILDGELLKAGISQSVIAGIIAQALGVKVEKDEDGKVINRVDLDTRMKTAAMLCKILGYDKPQPIEDEPENPIDYNQRREIRLQLIAELADRGTPPAAG